MLVKIFVCPTDGCGNYFASSSQETRMQTVVGQKGVNFEPRPASMHHKRQECPDCRSRGKRVERVEMTLNVDPVAVAV